MVFEVDFGKENRLMWMKHEILDQKPDVKCYNAEINFTTNNSITNTHCLDNQQSILLKLPCETKPVIVQCDSSTKTIKKETVIKQPKKRGPKKKQMTVERVQKLKVRRVRANTRERHRMHGLNDALEVLRKHMPCFLQNSAHKLSKIETLRLARNYILALSNMLRHGSTFSTMLFAQTLTQGLSQNTTNIVAGSMQISPRQLMQFKNLTNRQSSSFSNASNMPSISLSSGSSFVKFNSTPSQVSALSNSNCILNTFERTNSNSSTISTPQSAEYLPDNIYVQLPKVMFNQISFKSQY